LKKRLGVVSVVTVLVMTLFALSALATTAEMYFSTDTNGQNRVTNIQEGDEIFIIIYDPDENLDCDTRDKFTGDVKIMDPKTGAYIVWENCADFDADTNRCGDYFEETGADTGLFVSDRQFQIGTRESYSTGAHSLGKYVYFTHVVDEDVPAVDFHWGNFIYDGAASGTNVDGDDRGYFQANGSSVWTFMPFATEVLECMAQSPSKLPHAASISENDFLRGRFENMDTLVGMYQDHNDATDVAVAMMKIIDTEATITWDAEVYKDANGAAKITVVDLDENLNCNKIEYVPVFVLVNPGSWNQTGSLVTVNSFCSLKFNGGWQTGGTSGTAVKPTMRWFNIYEDRFIRYPQLGTDAVGTFKTLFDTTNLFVPVVFFAQETGVSTGVFEFDFNSLLIDLEFNTLNVRDVLVAYYLDPNDFDDFKLTTAYIEERQHSITSFTDATRADKNLYWIGRDPIYVQVIDSNANVDPCCPEQVVVHICDPHAEDDAEWAILDETSSNSPVFFTNAGMRLLPVWDALGVGLVNGMGGYQLQLDNWRFEVFNEDDVYVRYNDVYYTQASMNGLGDQSTGTAFPPQIDRIRVSNDVSFDTMSIGDTQVYDGQRTQMWFLDRQGNRVSGYVNSDCIFLEVLDPDQDEDQLRRERIDGYWDGGQNVPFGPVATEPFKCDETYDLKRCVNHLLGRVNIFNDNPADSLPHKYPSQTQVEDAGWAKIYVMNPRSGMWAALDLLETGVGTGDFVSTICVDLTSVYQGCVPTLRVLPGDTIVAVYQDPSNHSDSSWISVKVGIGGGGTPPTQQSSTSFVDSAGVEVTNYTDADTVYVKVADPSHAGATVLANAVDIDGTTYDLAPLAGAQNDTFITAGLSLALVAGSQITGTYTDPTDPTDTSSDTITIIASELDVVDFYAGPNPFDGDTTFGYNGSGIASVMSVTVYDLSGKIVWSEELANVTGIDWDGTNEGGAMLANGGYIYVITATDGTNTFNGKGTVFINR